MTDIESISPPQPGRSDDPTTSRTDEELLRVYAETRSDDVFGELVTRHIHWVFSVAQRRLENRALAEDATQVVFAALARKAASLGSRVVVSGWLFRAIRFAALDALKLETRRFRREQEASLMQFDQPDGDLEATPDAAWRELAPLVDDGLATLGEADRLAVLVRFYEQRPWREVGERLGTTEDAARVRVHRALEKLRRFLGRRGVTVSLVLLGGALLQHSVQAAPSGLVSATKVGAIGGGAVGMKTATDLLLRRLGWQAARRILSWVMAMVLVATLIFVWGRSTGLIGNPPATTVSIVELASFLHAIDQAFMDGDPAGFVAQIHFRTPGDRQDEALIREYISQTGIFRRQVGTAFGETFVTYYIALDELLAGRTPMTEPSDDPARAIASFAQDRPIRLIKIGGQWKWDFFAGFPPAQWSQRANVLQRKTETLMRLTAAIKSGTLSNLADTLDAWRNDSP
ncbi:MAG TPA: sigma-70 family RNA polymerase sigma factor [Candidatus Limnocylindria bacterium]|nr:sigma-70 family RNA polymerase sigma factor [Candidatus Limnocylindria bacterium]